MLYEFDGRRPEISARAGYVAPDAVLIGSVRLEADASVWFGAVLRGDSELISVARGSNVQDNAVLHTDPGWPLRIGEDVTVGHMVVLHGCEIGAGSLIGMGSVIMNGARIGRNCLIAAGTLISERKEFPDFSVIRGQPGKVIGTVTEAQIEMMRRGCLSYQDRAVLYRERLRRLPD